MMVDQVDLAIFESRLFISAADWLLNRKYDVTDITSKVVYRGERTVRDLFKDQYSLEHLPENNVHMIHPQTKQTFGFGIHIVNHKYGCQIVRIIENGIAARDAKLKLGDVIHTVNGKDVRNVSLGVILQHFSEIDISKKFCLTLLRIQQQDDGTYTVVEIEIAVSVKISDEKITLEIDIISRARTIRHQKTTEGKYLEHQTHQGRSSKYLRIDGETVTMSTKIDNQSAFQLELYEGDPKGIICVIRNVVTARVIDGDRELLAITKPSTGQHILTKIDDSFFYWKVIDASINESIFESVTKPGFFITVSQSDTLSLHKANMLTADRFNVISELSRRMNEIKIK